MKLSLANLFLFFLISSFYPSSKTSHAKCLHSKKLEKRVFPLALAIDILRKVYIVGSAILLDFTANSISMLVDAMQPELYLIFLVIIAIYNFQDFVTI